MRKTFFFLLIFLSYVPVLAQVDTAWVRRYSIPGEWVNTAECMAIDQYGNVYVTGWSWSWTSDTTDDYTTIKYSPTGDSEWVKRYDGPSNKSDNVRGIVVDNTANVYLTGQSGAGSKTYDDYATIKYYPNGDTAWVRIYNGSLNLDDEAFAIAVDDSGNVYVTGVTNDSLLCWKCGDYATIKYKYNGDIVWVRNYNGLGDSTDRAWAIAVDDFGNVYVTGQSKGNGTDHDCATIKYYSNGDTAWVRRYNGPANSSDIWQKIAVDDSGNVYVTGCSKGVGTGYDYATIKYYSNGDTAWVRRYNGTANSDDYVEAMVIDHLGNVYVTGKSVGEETEDDYATIKYYRNGDTAWVRRYNGPDDREDRASGIIVDDSGNVYVTGSSWSKETNWDYVTIKYYPNGQIAWIMTYDGSEKGADYPTAIAVDDSSNVYVTGKSYTPDRSKADCDYATIKYVQSKSKNEKDLQK